MLFEAHSPSLRAEIHGDSSRVIKQLSRTRVLLRVNSTVRQRTSAKEANRGHQGLHGSAIRESTRGFRQNDPLRGTRVVSTTTLKGRRGTERGYIDRTENIRPRNGILLCISRSAMAKRRRKKKHEISPDRIYSAGKFLWTAPCGIYIDVPPILGIKSFHEI